MSERDDYLLYVLSHHRELSWGQFKAFFAELYTPVIPIEDDSAEGTDSPSLQKIRWQVIRALEWLACCSIEFQSGAGVIKICPARLARLPVMGLPRAILCGARGPDTIAQLSQIAEDVGAEVRVCHQQTGLPFIPRQIEVQACSLQKMAIIAQKLGVSFSPTPLAHTLGTNRPTLQSIVNDSEWEQNGSLNWSRRIFNVRTLEFEVRSTGTAKLELHSYKDPVTGIARYYLIRTRDARDSGTLIKERLQVDLDWGRYIALHASDQNVLLYDSSALALAAPDRVPLPSSIAQLLTLCSGTLPVSQTLPVAVNTIAKSEQRAYQLFRSVPASVAEYVASIVSQKLIMGTLLLSPEEIYSFSSHIMGSPAK